jgi:hypothetical protein
VTIFHCSLGKSHKAGLTVLLICLNIMNKVLFGLDQPVFSGLIKITIVGKQKSKIVLIIWLAYFFTKHFKTKVLITFLL